MSSNNDQETREADDDVPDEVKHELGLRIVLLEVGQVGEDEGEEEVSDCDGHGGCVLIEKTLG